MVGVAVVVAALAGDLYWHTYANGSESYCAPEAAMAPNTPFVFAESRFAAYGNPEAELSRFGYLTWNETEFDLEANLGAVPVLRTSPLNSSARGMEIGNAWFFIAPGAPLLLDLRGLRLKTFGYRIEPPDPIHSWIIDQDLDGFIRIREPHLPVRELVLNTQESLESSPICPASIPFACPCVEYRNMAMCNGTILKHPRPICRKFSTYLPVELLMVAIVFVVGVGMRRFDLLPRRPTVTWVSAGLCVWLPANVIADGLVLIVPLYGGVMAAVVVLATQFGNLPLLGIKRLKLSHGMLRRCVVGSYLSGGVAMLLAVVALNAPVANSVGAVYRLMGLAAGVSGAAGAIGCTGLWGLVEEDAVRPLSVGMSLGSAFTGITLIAVKMTTSHPRIYYTTGFAVYVAAAIVGWIEARAEPKPTPDTERLLEESNDSDSEAAVDPIPEEKPKADALAGARAAVEARKTRHYYRAFFALYGVNYLLPSLFPFATRNGYAWYYAVVIVTLNLADSTGRALSNPRVFGYERTGYAMWAVGTTLALILMYSTRHQPYLEGIVFFAALLTIVAVATFIRGALVTEMQSAVKAGTDGTAKGWWLAAMGQAGGCAGAIVGLVLAVTYHQ